MCSCIAMGCDPTRSTFVYSNCLYVNDRSKCTSGMFMQSHAMSCHVCKVSRQVESHTCLVNFTLLLRRFTCIQAFSGGWREVVLSNHHEKAWIQVKRRDRRVKFTEQVCDSTCLLHCMTLHDFAWCCMTMHDFAWTYHSWTCFSYLHINSCYKQMWTESDHIP